MSNKEAAAIGCNLSFAPVSDILYNWENPVIGLRTYGNDVDRVCEMTKAYMDGAHTPMRDSAVLRSIFRATDWTSATSTWQTASMT